MTIMMDAKFLTAAMTLACIVDITRCGEYPAGLDPRSCPDYPNCDNAVLHGGNRGLEKSRSFANGWDSGNSWKPISTAPLTAGWNSKKSRSFRSRFLPQPLASAARYPAGVDPRSCPSYPNCDNAALHRTRDALTALGDSQSTLWNERDNQERIRNWNDEENSNGGSNPPLPSRYPAGLNAQNCPDYPYC